MKKIWKNYFDFFLKKNFADLICVYHFTVFHIALIQPYRKCRKARDCSTSNEIFCNLFKSDFKSSFQHFFFRGLIKYYCIIYYANIFLLLILDLAHLF